MKRLVITIIILLTGCQFVDQPHFEVDPRLEHWVNKFYEAGVARGVDLQKDFLTVQFTRHQKGDELGRGKCGKFPWVEISYYEYSYRMTAFGHGKQVDSLALEYLIFHELGHAWVCRGHCGSYSIMETGSGNKTYYPYQHKDSTAFRERMLDEMFK